MTVDLHAVPVIQPGPPEVAIRNAKPQSSHQVQLELGRCTKASYASCVGWDLRLQLAQDAQQPRPLA